MRASATSTLLTRVARYANSARLFPFLTAAAALAACSEPTAPPAASTDVQAALSASASAQFISFSNVYYWSQGDPPTYMGANGTFGIKRVCFLTRVSGRFTSYNESVRIYLVGKDWYLSGSSSTGGIGAAARCMAVLDYSQEYMRLSGQSTVLNQGNTRMCFLTGLGGQLADGDMVGLTAPVPGFPPKWQVWAYGASGSSNDLWVGARCARPLDGAANIVTTIGWLGGPPIPLTSSNGKVCMLRALTGPFDNSAAYGHVFTLFNEWWISGGNTSVEASVYPGCFSG